MQFENLTNFVGSALLSIFQVMSDTEIMVIYHWNDVAAELNSAGKSLSFYMK